MIPTRRTHESKLRRVLSKIFVSGFVVLSFAAYVVHERASGSDQTVLASPQVVPTQVRTQTQTQTQSKSLAPTAVPTLQRLPTAFRRATITPQIILPTATPENVSVYRDGTFTGQSEDAYFGLVQVQATIQGGKITDVEFLDYPRDRRTSQRINSIAVPYLQQEAIQAQSANVDIISGATLTSEAFIRSLDGALKKASGL